MTKISLNKNFYINNTLVYAIKDDDMYFILDVHNNMEYGAASTLKDAIEDAKETLLEEYSEYNY